MSPPPVRWRGVIGIPQTPYLADGRVDHDSLARGVEDRIEAGSVALLATVVASENDRLTPQERREVLDTVLQTNVGRLPVLVGTAASSVEESLDFGTYAVSQGCTGLLVQPPAEACVDRRSLTAYLERMRDSGTDLLMLQDLDWNGGGLPLATILHAIESIEELRCVKVEVTPAGPKYTALLEATDGQVHVSGGWAATQLIEALDRGVHAIAAGGSHWTFARIIGLYDAGRRDEAVAVFARLVPALAFSHQHIDVSNWMLKEVAVEQGLYARSDVRSPVVPVDAYHRRVGHEHVLDLLALEEEARSLGATQALAGSERC